jgi:hypothetical protein
MRAKGKLSRAVSASGPETSAKTEGIVSTCIYQSPGLPLWMRSYAHHVVLYLNNVLIVYAYKALAAEINMPIDTQHINCSQNVCNICM